MNIADKFHQFERSFDLTEFTVDGFWYYPIAKMAIYFELAGQPGTGNTEEKPGGSGKRQLISQLVSAFKWKYKSKLPRSTEYLFVDNALTRRQIGTGRYENMYIGPVMNTIDKDKQLLLEYPAPDFGHYSDIDKNNIYFPDWDIIKIFIKARFRKKKRITDTASLRALYKLFDLAFDAHFLNDRLNKTFLFIEFFKKFLKKIHPRVVLLIDGYNYKQMALIFAAKELGIPIIELQHGLINTSHMAYMYSQVIDKRLFADYLFTFGEYFSGIIERNSAAWGKERVLSMGFPYIETIKERPAELPERLIELAGQHTIIYVTSQWTVRDNLKSFIIQLSEKLDREYFIFYKIHPGEKNAFSFYKEFAGKHNLELILDKTVNSLEIMKVADVHSTVYSTSYFESVFFELPNIFIEALRYSKNIEDFVDDETSFLAKDINQYLTYLNSIKTDASLAQNLHKKKYFYYRSDALNTMSNIIDKIVNPTGT